MCTECEQNRFLIREKIQCCQESLRSTVEEEHVVGFHRVLACIIHRKVGGRRMREIVLSTS